MKQFLRIILSFILAVVTPLPSFGQVSAIEGTSAREVVVDRNYMKDGDAERYAPAGTLYKWVCYNDGANARPVDATGGTATVTMTTSTTTPLQGLKSFIFTKPSGNVQGQGCSYDFQLDGDLTPTIYALTGQYKVNSGTFTAATSTTDSDVIVDVLALNPNTSIWEIIEPSNIKLFNSSSTFKDSYGGTYQSTPYSVTYRIALHIATTTTNAFSLKWDEFRAGKPRINPGIPQYGPVTYTPTITTGSGALSNFTVTAQHSRIGRYLHVDGLISFSGASSSYSGPLVSMPAGLSIDTAALNSAASHTIGKGLQTTSIGYGIGVFVNNATTVALIANTTASGTNPVAVTNAAMTNTYPATVASGTTINFSFDVPVVGWANFSNVSDGTGGPAVVASYITTSQTITAGGGPTIINASTKELDNYGAVTTGASWKFVSPKAGFYAVSYASLHGSVAITQGASLDAQVFKNGSAYRYLSAHVQQSTQSIPDIISGTAVVYLNVGDNVDIRESLGGSTNASIAQASIYVYQIGGGSSPAFQTEAVSARYTNTAGTTVPTSNGLMPFVTKDYDDAGAFSSGLYTCPKAMKVRVTAILLVSASIATNQSTGSSLFINGVSAVQLNFIGGNGGSNVLYQIGGSATVRCKQGDTLGIYAFSQVAGTLNNGATSNSVTFDKIAEY